MENLREQWVKPYYMDVLHANYVSFEGDRLNAFVSRVREALVVVDHSVIERLLEINGPDSSWRDWLTGGWFTGLKRWKQYADRVGEILLKSQTPYAAQGACFALARFDDDAAIKYLTAYLDHYLLDTDLSYDQNWAMSALIWIDRSQSSKYSDAYLKPGGPWEAFVGRKPHWSLAQSLTVFESAMLFCQEWFDR
jgi:hypothetical protein